MHRSNRLECTQQGPVAWILCHNLQVCCIFPACCLITCTRHIIYLVTLSKVTCVCMTNPLKVCSWVRLREFSPLKRWDKKHPLEQAVEEQRREKVGLVLGRIKETKEVPETCRGHEDVVWETVSVIKGYWEIWLIWYSHTAGCICFGTHVRVVLRGICSEEHMLSPPQQFRNSAQRSLKMYHWGRGAEAAGTKQLWSLNLAATWKTSLKGFQGKDSFELSLKLLKYLRL